MVYELSGNMLESESPIPCDSKLNFTFDDCIYEAMFDEMINKVDCVVPFMPLSNLSESIKVCSGQSKAEIYKYMSFYEYLSSNGQRNFCSMPCSAMDVFLGPIFDGVGDENESYIKLYLKSTAKNKKTVYDFDIMNLIAEIGGTTGLLLGVSVVDMTTLINRLSYQFIYH